MLNRPFMIEKEIAVGKGIGRDIQDTHDQGPLPQFKDPVVEMQGK
jgi:hypothetical protein